MAYKPTRMKQIRQIIIYHQEQVSIRKIARLMGMSKNTVKQYLRRFEDSGLSLEDLENAELAKELFRPEQQQLDPRELDLQSRLPKLNKELGRVGVTRELLWEEYILEYPAGFSYSRFCRKLRQYRKIQDSTLRIDHKAAHKMQADFSGKKVPWIDKETGEVHYAEVLVCTLPYSGHTFVYAVASQKQEYFIEGLNQAFLYYGGVPRVLLSDNLKSYVTQADRYEPTFSELCIQLSRHYGIDLEATRVAKPKDKGHVEKHVNIIYNRLYGPLRNEVFHSIHEINQAFKIELANHNHKNYTNKDYSRHDLFIRDEKDHLSVLPATPFEIIKSTKAKVQRNYHVILGEDKHQYSVPYQYIGKSTQIQYTSKTVEVYVGVEKIAHHRRDRRNHGYTTLPGHMPEKHKKYLEQKGWDKDYFIKQAQKVGSDTVWAIEQILASKCIIEQSYRSCIGLLRLEDKYGAERLEKACTRARSAHRISYGIIKNILQKNLDQVPFKKEPDLFSIPEHNNIRGVDHYQ